MKADATDKTFQVVTKEGKVVAEFTLSEDDQVVIVMEGGVPQMRDFDSAAGPESQTESPDSDRQSSRTERAKTLLQKKEYDAVISLLSDEAYRRPNDFELNVLLARAEVEKSEQQKERGDSSYKALLMSAYRRGQRLYNMNRSHPEPYYIVAKSLYLNDRASKAYDVVRKAVYYDPLNPYYQLLYGDLSMAQAATWQYDWEDTGYVPEMHNQALGAYEKALLNTNDEELKKKIRAKIDRIHKLN